MIALLDVAPLDVASLYDVLLDVALLDDVLLDVAVLPVTPWRPLCAGVETAEGATERT